MPYQFHPEGAGNPEPGCRDYDRYVLIREEHEWVRRADGRPCSLPTVYTQLAAGSYKAMQAVGRLVGYAPASEEQMDDWQRLGNRWKSRDGHYYKIDPWRWHNRIPTSPEHCAWLAQWDEDRATAAGKRKPTEWPKASEDAIFLASQRINERSFFSR